MKKKLAIVLAAAMVMGSLAGCGNGGSQTSSSAVASSVATTGERQEFVHGVYNIEKLDPADNYNGWGTSRYGVGETLFALDDALNTVPKLATEYKMADDKLTWTITLREGVKFHNGKTMDAAAVKACLERTIDKNERAKGQLDIAKIEADGLKLTITTNKPNPTLINSLTDPYASIIDVTAEGDYNFTAVGTGPFKVVNYIEKEKVELEAFDEYWGGKPAASKVTVKGVADIDSLNMALQNGEVDSAYGLSYDTLSIYKNSDQYEITQAPTTRVYMLYYNINHEFMNDPNFRKAISMAVDKKTYGEVLINGAGTATVSAFPDALAYGKDSAIKNQTTYDVKAAAELLKSSGYVDTDNDGIIEKNGKNVSLRLVTYGRAGLPQSAQALQSALKELGIDVQYEQLESVDKECKAGNYDICAYACVTTPTGDPHSYLNTIAHSTGNLNFGYNNPEVDKLIEQLQEEFDTAKRAELAIEIQNKLLEDDSFCFMFHLNMFMAYKKGVKGINQSSVDYYHITKDTCRG